MATTDRVVQVQYAIDDLGRGTAIADALLSSRLVACIQRIGPVRSRYHWKGAVEEAEEWLFVAKTAVALADAVTRRIEALHPYETPEVLVTPVVHGLESYLAWVEAETVAAEEP